jgi:ComF family protein
LIRTEELVCLSCEQHLPRTGYHADPDNETSQRFAGRIPFERATSFTYFVEGGLIQHLLHRVKYGRRSDIAVSIGHLLGDELKAAGWSTGIDAIIPVPLHWRKEARRGYNQSEQLAIGISEHTGVPVWSKVLKRTRFTESQTDKSRQERLLNVADAFAVKQPTRLSGKHILLVDDVLTTGATMESCAHALLKVPGLRISLATAAIASS